MATRDRSRRRLLVGAGSAVTVLAAGCLGDDDDPNGTDTGDGADADPDDSTGASDEAADGEPPTDDDPDDDDPGEEDPDDAGFTAVPDPVPTDPDDDDFIDHTGADEVEISTREGREDEPNFVYDPPFVRVDAGTTVRWVNRDGVFHTVTSTDSLDRRSGGGDEFDGTISSEGDEFEWVANGDGRQDYYCSPHAGFMFGSVDVV